MRRIFMSAFVLIAVGVSVTLSATFIDADRTVAIDPGKGVDHQVDYEALAAFGPWDDRNYSLTREDLEYLPAGDAQMKTRVPAFFRVGLRREAKRLGLDTFVQYPLSAWNVFRQRYGGYLVDGVYYTQVRREGDRFVVMMEDGETVPPLAGEAVAIPSEVRVTSPEGAAESAIAISPVDTTRLVAGSNGPNGGQRMHYSTDSGATWTQVDLPLGGTCCDPTVEWSSDGQFAYTAALGSCSFSCNLLFYRSDDGGVTWTSLETETPGDPRRVVGTQADREFLHVDQSPASPFMDRIYMMWHKGNVMQMSRSADFGDSWNNFVFSSAPEDRGIAGDIATDRAGNVYYAWPTLNTPKIKVRKSSDGGASFGASVDVAKLDTSFSFPIPAPVTDRSPIASTWCGPTTTEPNRAFLRTTTLDYSWRIPGMVAIHGPSPRPTRLPTSTRSIAGSRSSQSVPMEWCTLFSTTRDEQWTVCRQTCSTPSRSMAAPIGPRRNGSPPRCPPTSTTASNSVITAGSIS